MSPTIDIIYFVRKPLLIQNNSKSLKSPELPCFTVFKNFEFQICLDFKSYYLPQNSCIDVIGYVHKLRNAIFRHFIEA
jgi:hypothetical protein